MSPIRTDESLVFEQMADAVMCCDADGNIVYANAALAQALSRERTSLEGQNLAKVIDRPELHKAFHRVAESGVRERVEYDDVRSGKRYEDHLYRTDARVWIVSRDVTERKLASVRLEILSKASRVFSEMGGDVQSIFDGIAHEVANVLKDGCVIRLLSEDGTEFCAPVGAWDCDAESLKVLKAAPALKSSDNPGGEILRTGRPVIVAGLKPRDAAEQIAPPYRQQIVEDLGVHSAMVVPLKAQGRILGILSVFRRAKGTQAPYTDHDLRLLEDLAHRAALAVNQWRTLRLLEQSRQQMATIADALPALVSFVAKNETYNFVNATYEKWFGRARSDIVGKPLVELIGRKAYASISHYVHRALAGETVTFAARVPYALGGVRDVEATYTPYFTDGEIEGFIALVLDVSARVRLAEEREELQVREHHAKERLVTLAETAKRFSEAKLDLQVVLKTICKEVAHRVMESCTINLINPAGTHLELAETCHIDPEAERGIREVLLSTPVSVGETDVGAVASTGKPVLVPVVPLEAMLATTRPEYRQYLERFPIASLLVVPLRAGERIIGTMTAARGKQQPAFTTDDLHLLQDIADRAASTIENARLAERLQLSMNEAQQAVRTRDDFLSIAGHELKTPLAALQLQVESLSRQTEKGAFGGDHSRLLERLNKAQSHVERLTQLIAGLLDVSRISSGKLVLEYEEVDLGSLLEDVVDRFSESLRRAHCEVQVTASEPVVAQWDRARLDQVFTNLVSNAVKYGSGKPIQISIARDDGSAVVAVADHGIGISEKDQARIFGRFERAVPEQNYGGLGLGLWISREIVKALGGKINVESHLGQGSTFTVSLPLQVRRDS